MLQRVSAEQIIDGFPLPVRQGTGDSFLAATAAALLLQRQPKEYAKTPDVGTLAAVLHRASPDRPVDLGEQMGLRSYVAALGHHVDFVHRKAYPADIWALGYQAGAATMRACGVPIREVPGPEKFEYLRRAFNALKSTVDMQRGLGLYRIIESPPATHELEKAMEARIRLGDVVVAPLQPLTEGERPQAGVLFRMPGQGSNSTNNMELTVYRPQLDDGRTAAEAFETYPFSQAVKLILPGADLMGIHGNTANI